MRIADLHYKEVINISNGHRLGYISDVDMDHTTGRVLALIVPGPYRFMGLFGREADYILPWESIIRIGDDIVLIDDSAEIQRPRRERRTGERKN